MLQSSQKYHLVVKHVVEHLVMILKKHTTDYKPMEKSETVDITILFVHVLGQT